MEPTIYKPSIYNGAGVYKIGGADGGGGGPNVENVKFLANGLFYTDFPQSGSINGVTQDPTFPITGLPVINSNNISSDGVYFQNNFIKKIYSNLVSFTIDFWFKGISHNRNYTPYFIGFSRLNENDYMLTTDYYDGLTNFLFPKFFPVGLERFTLEKNIWHHIAGTFDNSGLKGSSKLFIDGYLIKTLNNYWTYSTEEYLLKLNKQSNTVYSLGQICIREGIVWDSNFTPPTTPYNLI